MPGAKVLEYLTAAQLAHLAGLLRLLVTLVTLVQGYR